VNCPLAEADEDVKGHPGNGKPACLVLGAQQEYAADDCERFSELDPNPIGRATVDQVDCGTVESHEEKKAGD